MLVTSGPMMRSKKTILSWLCVGLFVNSVLSQPSNDICTAADSLLINGAPVLGTTIDATTSTNSGCGVTKNSPEVFYLVTGNGRRLSATTCAEESVTDFQTSLTLWSSQCSTCSRGSTVDSECANGNAARVTWDSNEDQVYTLVVHGRQADATGSFAISVTDFVNPPNDYCPQARSLIVNGDVIDGTTVNATTRTSSGCGVVKQAPEVFYQVTGNGRRMTATTCHDATDFDTALTLWSSLCSTCNTGSTRDDSCGNARGARVTWDSNADQVYTLLVYGRQAGREGNFGLSVEDFVNPDNDVCDQAPSLFPGGAQIVGSTVNATTRSSSGCGVTKQAPEVFYTVTGTGGTLRVTTCSDLTDFETAVTLWSFRCSTCNTGSVVDSTCPNSNGAAIEWDTTLDQVYTILVYGRQQGATGQFGIRVFDPNDNTTRVPTPTPDTSSPTTSPKDIFTTDDPTSSPTGIPTDSPTTSPKDIFTTDDPTSSPTGIPTDTPTGIPTKTPTGSPAASTGSPSVVTDPAASALAIQYQNSLNELKSDIDKSESLSIVAIVLSVITFLVLAGRAAYLHFIASSRKSKGEAEPVLDKNESENADVA